MNSLKVSWEEPKQPNGEITGYVVTYETAQQDESFSKQVKQKVTTTWLVVANLEEEVTYYFSVRASTFDLGPPATGNVTTGPQEGSPGRLKDLLIARTTSSINLQWENGPAGKVPTTGLSHPQIEVIDTSDDDTAPSATSNTNTTNLRQQDLNRGTGDVSFQSYSQSAQCDEFAEYENQFRSPSGGSLVVPNQKPAFGDVDPDQPLMRFDESHIRNTNDNAAKAPVTFDNAEAVSFPTSSAPRWAEGFDCLSHETPCHLGCWEGMLANFNDSGVADMHDSFSLSSHTLYQRAL
jgi:hypothetical protein